MVREAAYYEVREKGKVACLLCPNRCVIAPGKAGICRVRFNRDGRLEARNYGEVTSLAMDPIEKKPLYQFYPGHWILSLGTWGCNLHCRFCQNWEIAHGEPESVAVAPERVVDMALAERDRHCIGLAFTYSEPSVWYEFVRDTAVLAREKGLVNVLVTNGFLEEEPLKELLPYVDAMNIDVKAFTDEYYRRTCRGFLKPVLRTVELAAPRCHVELTTLLVTGLNDSPEEITRLVDWVAGVDRNIPLHFSRYFPNYRLNLPATPPETMRRAWTIARERLSYVYLGNMRDGEAESTYCPQCGKAVIERDGYLVHAVHLTEDNRCAFCGFAVHVTGKARVKTL
ncbi:MAG: AmmeMemoRadiSam system radical SAM enzyme [Thermoanaerobacterales bacterium]|nr:AmmeMemoRadiSam system radical SAM enzyme [Bacillota bacterium]MDI6907134.1 AmmeMemoRadiSam system radical SAM enzyme [Thermoanaerobacterales bacterium]